MCRENIAIFSHVALDVISWHDNENIKESIGGAGAYAAVGAALVNRLPVANSNKIMPVLVAGVGETQFPYFASWCLNHKISDQGLFKIPISAPITKVLYFQEQNRQETSLLGSEHFLEATPMPKHLPSNVYISHAYLFHDVSENYWNTFLQWKQVSKAKFVWEISSDACSPEFLDAVIQYAESCTLLLINLTEAKQLFNVNNLTEVLKLLTSLPCPVVLHDGSSGSWLMESSNCVHIGVVPGITVADPTGGGNSFSGATTACLAHGLHLVDAVRVGSAVAAYVISHDGVPDVTCSAVKWIEANAQNIKALPVRFMP